MERACMRNPEFRIWFESGYFHGSRYAINRCRCTPSGDATATRRGRRATRPSGRCCAGGGEGAESFWTVQRHPWMLVTSHAVLLVAGTSFVWRWRTRFATTT
jgi:hypothetical protein